MIFIQSVWFFLPAIIANMCPGFAAVLDLPGARRPVSRKWLGAGKTYGAYYAGPFGGLITILLQAAIDPLTHRIELFDYSRGDLWLIGILFGLGAVLGDQIKSLFKRAHGIERGRSWWPFDQLDFVVGALILTAPLVGWIGLTRYGYIFLTVLCFHPLVNRIGYHLGHRNVP